MKKRDFTFSRKSYYLIMSLAGMLMMFYLVRVSRPLIALAHHQRFVGIPAEQSQFAAKTLENAIRFDRDNPRYHHELGMHLHHSSVEQSSLEEPQRKQGFQNAEESLKRAVMLNPGDPWNYYELARLSQSQGDESDPSACSSFENLENCPPASYFLTALQKSSNNQFLRRTVGRWFYDADPENAFNMIRPIISELSDDTKNSPEVIREYAKFLYDIQQDYASDLQYQKLKPDDAVKETCQLSKRNERHGTARIEVELGNDDGSHNWRTRLTSDIERIKKHICLPDDLTNYDYAAVKIFMKHAGSPSFVCRVYLNEDLIKEYHNDIPRTGTWHEIPFDISLLQGRSDIHVYIRVEGASHSTRNNHLLVFGDQETPNIQSMRDFQKTDDLSTDRGQQVGEYMIRLLLKAAEFSSKGLVEN